jgi:hypothetical protein
LDGYEGFVSESAQDEPDALFGEFQFPDQFPLADLTLAVLFPAPFPRETPQILEDLQLLGIEHLLDLGIADAPNARSRDEISHLGDPD